MLHREVQGIGDVMAHRPAVVVPDRGHQHVAQGALSEHLSQDVEYLAPEGLTGNLQLLQQAAVDLALAGVVGDEVPHMTLLGLTDPVDTSEALLKAVRVPGEVVVDHQ